MHELVSSRLQELVDGRVNVGLPLVVGEGGDRDSDCVSFANLQPGGWCGIIDTVSRVARMRLPMHRLSC